MDPLIRGAILLGMELAQLGLNKLEVSAYTEELESQGKTNEEIDAILRNMSADKSREIRELIAQKRASG